jgi:outer membrane protein assembly factor BamE
VVVKPLKRQQPRTRGRAREGVETLPTHCSIPILTFPLQGGRNEYGLMGNPVFYKATLMRFKFIIISIMLASCSDMSMPKLFTLSPYQIQVRQGNLITPEMLEKVRVGMPGAQVRAILGMPLIQDPFHANRWDYVYYLKQGDKLVDMQRLTLFFENDKLARIDDSNMPRQSPVTGPDAGDKEK